MLGAGSSETWPERRSFRINMSEHADGISPTAWAGLKATDAASRSDLSDGTLAISPCSSAFAVGMLWGQKNGYSRSAPNAVRLVSYNVLGDMCACTRCGARDVARGSGQMRGVQVCDAREEAFDFMSDRPGARTRARTRTHARTHGMHARARTHGMHARMARTHARAHART